MKDQLLEKLIFFYGHYFPFSFGKRRLINGFIFQSPHKQKVCQLPNFKIQIWLDDLIGALIYYTGSLDHNIDQLYRKIIKKNQTFVDVGANIGYYSLFASSLGANSIAFEADSEIFQELMQNVRLNSSKVIAHQYAVDDGKRDEVRFDKYYSNNNRGSGKISRRGNQLAKTVSLDNFFTDKEKRDITLIKIDVEGNELNVIKGSINILGNFSPDIFCEIWQDNATECLKILRNLGYKSYLLKDNLFKRKLTLFTDNKIPEGKADFYFSKRENISF